MITAPELAARLGLRKFPRDWRGACPSCGYSAAFSVRAGRDQRALAWCASCQDREGITRVLSQLTAGAWMPPEPSRPRDQSQDRAAKQAKALSLWNGSSPAADTLVDTYLSQRGLSSLALSSSLRFRDDCAHLQGGRFPAMIALVVDVDGTPVAAHRTFLDRVTARKANLDPPKLSLGPVWGGAIRLDPLIPGEPLVIGEGIETSASAGRMIGAPAWSAISAGNLGLGMRLPPEARDIIIAEDPGGPGEEAAQKAAARWLAEGRRVRIAHSKTSGDFNDLLMARCS